MSVTVPQERFVWLTSVAWLLLQAGIAAALWMGYLLQGVRAFGLPGSTTRITAEAATLLNVSGALFAFTAVGTLAVATIAVLVSPMLEKDGRWVPRAGIALTLIAFIVAVILLEIAGNVNA